MRRMCETAAETVLLRVPICRLPGHDDVPLPDYQSAHAAGMDIHAAVAEPLVIAPGQRMLVPTGFTMAVPEGYEAQIRPRSGLAYKHGLSVPNAPGTIDADYRGQVKVLLVNLGSEPVTVTRGMRIAQMLLKSVPRVAWDVVDDLTPTQRGDGGFGHTGHH